MRLALRQAFILALLALLPAGLAALLHPKRPSFSDRLHEGEISVEVAQRNPAGYLWIDARSVADYENRHVPSSLPLNEDEWVNLLPAVLEVWSSGKPVIVYCDSRRCRASEDVAKRLREFNLAPVFVLKGGWEAWQAAQEK